jgi:hypothetical protein
MVKKTIEDIKKEAEEAGFTLITEVYTGCTQKLEFKCPIKSHDSFTCRIDNLKSGATGCNECRKVKNDKERKSEFLSKCKAKAIEHEGKCLSRTYINNTTKMNYRCKDNHEFEMDWDTLSRGSWCPKCSGHGKKTYEEMVEDLHAINYDICDPAIDGHETIFKTVDTKMWVRCPQKHTMFATLSNIKKENCTICNQYAK